MPHYLSTFIAFSLPGVLSLSTLNAEQANPAEAKLREAVRSLTLQLRDARNEQVRAQTEQQAARAESDKEIKNLIGEVDMLTKQGVTEKDTAKKTIDELTERLGKQNGEVTRLTESLEKWKADHGKISQTAGTLEAQRDKLAAEAMGLRRCVADQQTKNAAMFQLGNEILKRYEKFGLGEALTAREPFIGTTRVKFENLIQDYHDKLADEKIKQ